MPERIVSCRQDLGSWSQLQIFVELGTVESSSRSAGGVDQSSARPIGAMVRLANLGNLLHVR
jgi:hypothetical protein